MNPMHHAPAQGPVRQDRLYVGGEWLDPVDGRPVDVINPLTEESIGRAALAGRADIDRAVGLRGRRSTPARGPRRRSRSARPSWSGPDSSSPRGRRSFREPSHSRSAHRCRSPRPKPQVCQLFLDWHAAQASTVPVGGGARGGPGATAGPPPARRGRRRHRPVELPAGLSFPKLAPALLAGCTVVLKPADETPLFGFLLPEVFADAGLPAGVLNIVPAGREVSEAPGRAPEVDKISFTGQHRAPAAASPRCAASSSGASASSSAASRPRSCSTTPTSTPCPARWRRMRDANNGPGLRGPDARARAIASATTTSSRRSREPIGSLRSATPRIPNRHRPADQRAQRDRVEGYIATAREEGAKLVLGGGRPDGRPRGWFVEPTVFADVDSTMPIAREEIFGPVLRDPLRRRGRRRRDRQRLRLRTGRLRVDGRRRARLGRRAPRALRQRYASTARLDLGGAVRRLQAVRSRARVRPRGDRGVRRGPDHPVCRAGAGAAVAPPKRMPELMGCTASWSGR